MDLQSEIEDVLDRCVSAVDRMEYQARLTEGALVRDENIHSHCCAYFVPYNPTTKQILVGDHKKSGLWLMPGGHIDANETLLTTLNREIEEELGVSNFYTQRPEPFLLSITNIVTDVRPCQKHFDIWHVMETNGEGLEIDYTEYNEVRWVTIKEARALVTDPANLMALDRLEKL
jgi:8-oxo-dGTP pyrophosphatase MutT (NUDIX family)